MKKRDRHRKRIEIDRLLVRTRKMHGLIPELEHILQELSIRPVWIGGIAVGLMVEPITTYDMDILVGKEDFPELKRRGAKFGIKYKGKARDRNMESFRYGGEALDCVVEGAQMGDYTMPPPDAVREKGFLPSIEGMFLLKLMRLNWKDRDHLSRLWDFKPPDEAKLRDLVQTYGTEELWQGYLRFRTLWTI